MKGRVIAAVARGMGEAYLAAYSRSGDDWDEVIAPRLADAASAPALPGRRWAATAAASTAIRGCAMQYRDAGGDALRGRSSARRRGGADRGAALRTRAGIPRPTRRPYTCATRWPSPPGKAEAKR